MARKTKEEKRVEVEVEAAFAKHGKGVQFNIMDLGKITTAGITAGLAGRDVDAAVVDAIAQYRKN